MRVMQYALNSLYKAIRSLLFCSATSPNSFRPSPPPLPSPAFLPKVSTTSAQFAFANVFQLCFSSIPGEVFAPQILFKGDIHIIRIFIFRLRGEPT